MDLVVSVCFVKQISSFRNVLANYLSAAKICNQNLSVMWCNFQLRT